MLWTLFQKWLRLFSSEATSCSWQTCHGWSCHEVVESWHELLAWFSWHSSPPTFLLPTLILAWETLLVDLQAAHQMHRPQQWNIGEGPRSTHLSKRSLLNSPPSHLRSCLQTQGGLQTRYLEGFLLVHSAQPHIGTNREAHFGQMIGAPWCEQCVPALVRGKFDSHENPPFLHPTRQTYLLVDW